MTRGTLEALILDALRDRLMAPELVETFIAEFHAEVNRLNREREHVHEARRGELDEVSRKLDGLIEAIAEGLRSPGLQAKLEELEIRKQSIEASIGEEPPPAPRLHPNLAELYRRNERLFRGAIPIACASSKRFPEVPKISQCLSVARQTILGMPIATKSK